jgi:CheY-like chemotaxis protein/two-component sensor histidine kinase
LGQLAGGVAHEFNNLLGVILTYSALLLRHATDPAAIADLEEIQTAAHSGTALTRQLLTFARRDMASPEPIEINAVIRSVATMLGPALAERIVLCLELDPGPLVTIADRHQLEQIVLNLASNAVDAMPTGGQLSITTTLAPRPVPDRDGGPHSHDIVIDVRDDGVGMPPEVARLAFEPFYSTKPAGHGTGLGLATVYGIVRDAGGEVSISSTPGESTTVTVTLPAANQTQPAAPEGPRTLGGSGEQILFVEDREALRRATERVLTADGYRVIVAADGVEALELYEHYKDSIDLVLTDVVMPRMRGDDLARALEAAGCSAPIVFMSGYDSHAEHDSLTHLLLPKPISTPELLRTIWEVLHD